MASTSSNIIQTAPIPSTPSSSFSKPQSKYEVFLSFRGKDTRNTFTDHLYHALDFYKGIRTFRDDEDLEMGRPVKPELLDAIETSRMAVIILSSDYASSSWCLEELAKIVECMKERGMRVLPVFYHLDPSVVRYQKGTFEEAFAKHEERFKEKMVQRWRAALKEVADLSGRHLEDGQSESKFIEDIVEKISQELNDMNDMINDKNGLVGIDSRVQEIMDLYMDMASDDVRFIGICGMSGIGKTTLAQAVFERVRRQFQANSFLSDVKRRDLDDLQDQLLQDMKLKKGEMPIRWDVLKGIRATSTRLSNKKVIIVLDDANEEKLEKLAGFHDWFGPGSRIIITTEDKGLLQRRCEKKNVYNAKKLNASDALELFSREAFGKPQWEKDLLDICNGFVSYVDGHPLALKILGSSMHDIPKIDLWKAELERLRESAELPKDDRIQTALRISYNGLSTPKKKLFLDIACFFHGEDKNRIVDILEGSGCIPEIDIKALIDKSLITILGGKLWMHNLLQQMGWEIVNQECIKRPGERSRLWLCEDVLEVLNNSKGTDSVEGILLNAPSQKEVRLNADSFSKIKKLRLLKICTHLHLPQGLSYLSNELRLMEWHEYPLKSMPTSFQPEKLVELVMHRSHIKQLPNGFSNLRRLKVMDLTNSQNLIKTPNFTGLPNLERVIFQGCTRLYEVHPSIGVLKRLTLLSLEDCKHLNSLPPKINLESLETLILSGCSRLKKFPDIGTSMTRLSELYLDGTAIEELPLSIEHLTGLTLLYLQDCNNFSSFPSVIGSLTSLKTLILSGLKVHPHKPWHSLGLSPILSLVGAAALTLWADFSLGLSPILSAIVATKLICLWTYCLFIAKHPEPKPNLLLLKSLLGLGSLVCLDLSDCNLEDGALPNDLSCLSSLQSLNLSKNHFTCLPDSVSQLSKLKFLYLDKCSRLKSLTNIPLSTKYVMARECTSLENYSNQVIVWTSGESGFTFINCLSLGDNEECKLSVPNQLELIHEQLNLQNIHLQPLWQRYMEDQMEQIDQSKGFNGVFHQTEIPKWFSHQNPEGSSVPIPLPPDLYENSRWRGIALCAIFEVDKNLKNEDSLAQDSKSFLEFKCRLDMDGGVVDSPLVFTFPKDKFYRPSSFGLWLYISHARFRSHLDVRGCISPSITTNTPHVEIKQCGARLVDEEDMVEFVKHFSQEALGSPDVLHQRHQEFIEYHKNSSESPDAQISDSNPRLKTELNTLLSILYQEDPARNHWYDYIFPQISIPRWFNYQQNSASDIRMQPPPNLHNNMRWMGFSVYALYTVDKQPTQDSTIFLNFSGLWAAGEASYRAFPLSRDIFFGSRRLLVFYIPRLLFGLNQWSEIWASFESNNPRVVKVEMCGIRIVYDQDIEEFVETLVQCMLECPNEYHQSYHLNLLSQVTELRGCDHGTDFSCSFTLQRRPQAMPRLLPSIENVAEEGCTSPETFSNQAGTSTVLGIPLRDYQPESTSSIRALEDQFKLHLKRTHINRNLFSICFPQSEIPEWFMHQSGRAPSVKIILPPNLYYNPEWMGFALCCVFSFHKHPSAINLDSGFRHRFMCHVETDLGCVSPLIESSISEAQVQNHQRSFIWVLFQPRWLLSEQWSEVSWIGFSFMSNSEHVSAVKCGVSLVYQENMEEFTRTYVQLMASFIAFAKDIRSRRSLPPPGGPEQMQYDHAYPHETGLLDFHPSFSYNYCFPPSKVTKEWFGQQSRGHSVTIDIPSNLYNDNNWKGFALCASFSIDGDPETIIDNWVSETPHFLNCRFRTGVAGVDDKDFGCGTTRIEILMLICLGQFIWISYVPGEPFKYMLRQCSSIEASFESDWQPCVTVQTCGFRLLFQHDQVEFEQKLEHCKALIDQLADSISQSAGGDHEKINEQNPNDIEVGSILTKDFLTQICKRPIEQAETDDQLGKRD